MRYEIQESKIYVLRIWHTKEKWKSPLISLDMNAFYP